nr:MAG TPA: hypothetical protein [Bacteriophage sp.]
MIRNFIELILAFELLTSLLELRLNRPALLLLSELLLFYLKLIMHTRSNSREATCGYYLTIPYCIIKSLLRPREIC